MTEVDNLDTQIQSTTKEGDAYKVSDELSNNLQNAQSDLKVKKRVRTHEGSSKYHDETA